MTSHLYKEEMSKEVAKRINECHIKEFETLLQNISTEDAL